MLIGFTPLLGLPAGEEEAVEMAAFLLARGADPGFQNRPRLTAEEAFCENGQEEVEPELSAIDPTRLRQPSTQYQLRGRRECAPSHEQCHDQPRDPRRAQDHGDNDK